MVSVTVNLSAPALAQRAAATGAAGVGLVRMEHIVYTLREHPDAYLRTGRVEEYVDVLTSALTPIFEAFPDNTVWVRTLDAPTDELSGMAGAQEEEEANPMLGWRGIRRDLDTPEHLRAEGRVFQNIRAAGFTNLGILLPMVTLPQQIHGARRILEESGLAVADVPLGVMVEIPAAALRIRELCETGIQYVSIGSNDLTQLTLGVDRTHPRLNKLYDERDRAVMALVKGVVDECAQHKIPVGVCGEAADDPDTVRLLVALGVSTLSVNIDAVARVRALCAEWEKGLAAS